MKKEIDRSKASFKLDLLETANADPMVKPADLKVLSAYVAVMAWPSCKAWLATSQAMAMTGLSDRQFEMSRRRLLGENPAKRAYLVAVHHNRKVSTYALINPWRDDAIAHVAAMHGYFKEVARQKKARQREAASLKNSRGHEANMSPKNLRGQEPACPRTFFGSVPENSSDNTPLMITPSKKGVREENSPGSNVVSFNRKGAA